ncbi:MAG: flagellar assembly peptidoglycan hydrolase FlgJ [Legionella sp.]|nr:MAG: flagellar assembly peptidoglycan hydrolase FlgJ [Legionella sp.]
MTVPTIAINDFQNLNELKVQAKEDAQKALPAVAKQFEGIFLQAMMKSMRMGQHFLDESSPFNSEHQQMFQDMLDAQYANNIAGSRGVGLAEMLAKQLEKTVPGAVKSLESEIPSVKLASMSAPVVKTAAQEKHQEFSSVDDFVKSIWPLAKQAASMIGLDPKVLMAQAALETGWGKFVTKDKDGTSSNNLFNIKTGADKTHDSVQVKTTEYIANTPLKVNDSFRKYPSLEHSFHDYISLIKGNDRYQHALASTSNPIAYVNELNKAGYATDPRYGSKILSIYNSDELNQAIQRCGLATES